MTVGILGGGQLGRMLALAGYPLGLRFRVLEPAPEAATEHVAERVPGAFDDPEWLDRFAAGLDLVTYEFENVPVTAVRHLARTVPVYPPAEALEAAQDRWVEKSFLQDLGIPTPPFLAVETHADLDQALDVLGLPAVLKTRRFGYDGKGQWFLHRPEHALEAWRALSGVPLILESFVPFDRELSILAVRGRDGRTAFYPLVENHHRAGMLRFSRAPAPGLTAALQEQAEDHARRVLEALGYVGVVAIEFFQVGDRLLANEMAPRVHNSGHWTIEGAETSQFENHLRAVLGWPLGSTVPLGQSAMINLIGTLPDLAAVLAVPQAHLHLYGKTPRPGRKLGHVTIRAPDDATLARRLEQIRAGAIGEPEAY
jgi:5-(carboxyamino)imidazole ribonucleotide synthase